MRWSMLLLLATPFKTVLTSKPADNWYQSHSLQSSSKVFSSYSRQFQVTVKFMPVHIPTPEEETDPILFAKVSQLFLFLVRWSFMKTRQCRGSWLWSWGFQRRMSRGWSSSESWEKKSDETKLYHLHLSSPESDSSFWKCEFWCKSIRWPVLTLLEFIP